MTKIDIIQHVYEKLGFSKKEAAEIVEAVFDIIKAKQEGSFQRGVFTYGLKNGGVGLSWSDVAKKNIPADVQQQLKDLEQQIIDGKIVAEDAK